ncbi:response regulator [Desulfuromonas thiophila]|jgi:two-component system chemotaxis response regulator CheY|uniref:Two-component system, chemotaxis family, response regulator CheY n=1 Tax=Desulfuromonas thiophila TaxID=57664 RepID=A0A1G7CV83_9BACT|nr:response regulator [Desulfuromonas thiophila]MDD3801832.1 response regulator [Desulfuromonas thiophila]MDY0399050.1 response regulator [Desulfuromonas thiophila]SDE43354.1 two-component system, chemotaxis family, response regulator CheY [Desulfuromonas thiophila]
MAILIVDDSAIAREILKKCLVMIGFSEDRILEAKNGVEALAIARTTAVRFIVTDLYMPQMDGEGLIKWIKANPRLNHIPIFVVSSAGNDAKASRLYELGVEGTTGKPIQPKVLKALLADYTESDNGYAS